MYGVAGEKETGRQQIGRFLPTSTTLPNYIQRKPNNRELASPCQLICKIIHVNRERLVPYYRVFSVHETRRANDSIRPSTTSIRSTNR
jgi:hypothetical protein